MYYAIVGRNVKNSIHFLAIFVVVGHFTWFIHCREAMEREKAILHFIVGFLSLLLIFWIPNGLEALNWCLIAIGPAAIGRAIFLLYRQQSKLEDKSESSSEMLKR